MKNYKIIKELESNNSRLFKEEVILREMKNNNQKLFEAFFYACDKLLTFGVKQVPISKKSGEGLNWEIFKDLLNKLNRRIITGNKAKEEIKIAMQKCSESEWNYFYRRILIKDLRCGLSEKTINNVAKKNNFPEFSIPVFSCQLAQDSEHHKKKLNGEKIIEVKLDGVRVISILHCDGKVDMFSRNGKELLNFEKVKKQLADSISRQKIATSIVLDGEIVSKNFQELMKQIYRKDNLQNNDANLYLFDFLTFDEFKKGKSIENQKERIKLLKKWFNSRKELLDNVKLLNSEIIDLSTSEGNKRFVSINKSAVIDGFEGIMIKDPNAIYESKRSFHWLKLKPVIEISLKVTSVDEGTGRNKNKLGAVTAEGTEENKRFKISVGSGFSDNQRISFWKEKDNLIGQIIEIKADAITKSQDGEFWSLRFPRFKTFRGYEIDEKM
ncbi:MAG: ATP-dependent DNA ligase [Rickettsiales bacterium]|nr:ATP-dependent DNA ligase [Rickettsiales bacterium]OUV52869.1 MAG: hypothetical protein CBC87_05805 [Rickettsiales bacterium TMED127]|tara:strand:+ start:9613 stop:10932 length:1320 start_codon:yes stop_codon:yes gene_type:complete